MKFQDHAAPGIETFASHLNEPLDPFQLFLLLGDDLFLDFLRAGAGPPGLNSDFDLFNFGGQLDRNAEKGDEAKKTDEDYPNGHSHRKFY